MRKFLLTMRVVGCLLAPLFAAPAPADEMTVTVLDRDGEPIPGVAVYLEDAATPASSGRGRTAVMDQVDTRFVPHLLVVQKGTLVEFPNSDPIAHHVYSFSQPNDFQLPLYKGDVHEPIAFDHPGLVTLGCNIHDQMLAYILIVDGPVFGMTNEAGQVTLDSPASAGATVSIWSPRIRPRGETLTLDASTAEVVFQLQGRLRPPHDSDRGGVEWSDY
jgi:plastocyanin